MIGKKAEPYLLLLPAVALALMFSILPFMRTVFLSFMKVTQGGDVIGFGGLSSYKSLFADKAFIRSIGHTLLFVLLFIPLNTALTLLAAVLTRRKGRRTGIAEFIFFSPMAISLSAYGMIFSEMFRGRISIANRMITIGWTLQRKGELYNGSGDYSGLKQEGLEAIDCSSFLELQWWPPEFPNQDSGQDPSPDFSTLICRILQSCTKNPAYKSGTGLSKPILDS